MTPYHFARAECANMLPDGSCLGIRVEDLFDWGQEKFARPKPKCLLSLPPGTSIVREPQSLRSWADLDKLIRRAGKKTAYTFPRRRCRYFARCVLPIADKASPKDEPRLQARRLKAREAYFRQFPEARKAFDSQSSEVEPKRPPRRDRPAKSRACPDCGVLLARRQRYCASCAGKHRKASKLASYHRARLDT